MTTRPDYIPSWVPNYCEVQYTDRDELCGNTPVVIGYIPANNVIGAVIDNPQTRIKWSCNWHGGKDHSLGTLEEIFQPEPD